MNLKSLRFDNRLHIGFTLLLVWFAAIWHFRESGDILLIILYPLLAIATTAALDVGLTWFRFRKTYLPTAAVVSGFLIGLIISPSGPLYVILTAAILASVSKQFLSAGARQHIFNPAAFGIMGAYFAFGTTVSWWAVSWSWYPLLIIVPLIARILWKLKRLILPATFLVLFFVYLAVTTSLNFALRTIVDPTVVMFAMIMLPEPITSPAVKYFKFAFGPIVATLAIVISAWGKIPEIFLPALLFSNLGSFLLLRLKNFSKKQVQ